MAAEYDFISARRGKGFIQGLVIEGRKVGDIVAKCLEKGLVVISAGTNVLRFLPPLIVTEADIDEMTAKLREALK